MGSYDSEKIAHIHDELHSHLPSEPALRTKALESLLVEKGLLKGKELDEVLDLRAMTELGVPGEREERK